MTKFLTFCITDSNPNNAQQIGIIGSGRLLGLGCGALKTILQFLLFDLEEHYEARNIFKKQFKRPYSK